MSDSDTTSSSRTDWQRLAEMTDDEIDMSDIPEITEEMFSRAVWRNRSPVSVTLSLDPVVLAWFKSQGDDWEQRIDKALREYVRDHVGTDEDRASA
jgi:uncharacterized protein (DUF4415 family)